MCLRRYGRRRERKEEGLAKFMTDGLHLNADGYTVGHGQLPLRMSCGAECAIGVVYDELIKTIKENMPELYYEKLTTGLRTVSFCGYAISGR